jgi:hypothetical protein
MLIHPRVPLAARASGIEAWLREGFLVSLPSLCEIEGCPMAHMSGRLDDYWAPPGVMVLVWGCPKPGDF